MSLIISSDTPLPTLLAVICDAVNGVASRGQPPARQVGNLPYLAKRRTKEALKPTIVGFVGTDGRPVSVFSFKRVRARGGLLSRSELFLATFPGARVETAGTSPKAYCQPCTLFCSKKITAEFGSRGHKWYDAEGGSPHVDADLVKFSTCRVSRRVREGCIGPCRFPGRPLLARGIGRASGARRRDVARSSVWRLPKGNGANGGGVNRRAGGPLAWPTEANGSIGGSFWSGRGGY